MTGPRRTKTPASRGAAVREEIFVATSGPSLMPRPARAAELVRRVAELEGKLRSREQEHAGDAELIGNLLGELADRDRRIKALEQRSLEEETRRVDVETELAMVESRTHVGSDRTLELESALRRTDRLFAELLRRLSDAHGGEVDVSQLHDLLAVTMTALDLTHSITTDTAKTLEDTRTAMVHIGAQAAERGLEGTLGRANAVLDASSPVDRSIARVVERLREVERHERELGDLRAVVLAEAGELVSTVQQLRDAMGNLARRPESLARMPRVAPKPPPRR